MCLHAFQHFKISMLWWIDSKWCTVKCSSSQKCMHVCIKMLLTILWLKVWTEQRKFEWIEQVIPKGKYLSFNTNKIENAMCRVECAISRDDDEPTDRLTIANRLLEYLRSFNPVALALRFVSFSLLKWGFSSMQCSCVQWKEISVNLTDFMPDWYKHQNDAYIAPHMRFSK